MRAASWVRGFFPVGESEFGMPNQDEGFFTGQAVRHIVVCCVPSPLEIVEGSGYFTSDPWGIRRHPESLLSR